MVVLLLLNLGCGRLWELAGILEAGKRLTIISREPWLYSLCLSSDNKRKGLKIYAHPLAVVRKHFRYLAHTITKRPIRLWLLMLVKIKIWNRGMNAAEANCRSNSPSRPYRAPLFHAFQRDKIPSPPPTQTLRTTLWTKSPFLT